MAKRCNFDSRKTHKYHKVSAARVLVWACANPTCSHYIPKHIEGMILGKMSICWECDGEFVMDIDAIKMDMPSCLKCRMTNNDNIEHDIFEHLKEKSQNKMFD